MEGYSPLSSHMIGVKLSDADKVAMRDLPCGYPSWPAVQTETAPSSAPSDADAGALKEYCYMRV